MDESDDEPTGFLRLRRIPKPKLAPENARKWIFIKFGLKTPCMRDTNVLITFCDELFKIMEKEDLCLDIRPTISLTSAREEKEIVNALDTMTHGVLNDPPLRLPILLFIEDFDGPEIFGSLQERYHNHMFMFLITGAEAETMIRMGTFAQAEEWCKEFGEIVKKNDLIRAQEYPQLRRRKEIEQHQQNIKATTSRNIDSYSEERNIYASHEPKFPELVDSDDDECAHINRGNANTNEVYRIIDTPELEEPKTPYFNEILINDVMDALHALESEQNPRDSTLITYLNTNALHHRLKNPFKDLYANIKTIEMIELACRTEKENMLEMVEELLRVAISSNFVGHILHDYLIPIIEGRMILDLKANELAYCVSIVLRFFEILSLRDLINKETMELWNTIHAILDELSLEVKVLMPADTDETLQIIMDGPKATTRQVATEAMPNLSKEKKTLFSSENDFESDYTYTNDPDKKPLKKEFNLPSCSEQPDVLNLNVPCLWAESEKIAPPTDFRTLSTEIVRADLVDPERPYLRRMKTIGSFNDAEDYLDTVYRLFREDMVSPFRDGLFIWKQHGYNPRRDLDGLSPDLYIVEGVRIRGIQVRSGFGDTMRMMEIPRHHISKVMEMKKLSYGQMIGLSCDGFKEDIHLAYIVERDDDLLRARNYIGISFVDERDTINFNTVVKLDTEYCLVESGAFLEMYTHVLKTIKGINRFLPIPFERYLVHGCTNVLPPAFMRLETPADVVQEMSRIQTYYTSKRLEATAKLLASDAEKQENKFDMSESFDTLEFENSNRRRKKNRKSPLPAIDLSDTNLTESNQLKKRNLEDLENNEIRKQIEEAQYYVSRPYAPSQTMLRRISIHDQEYEVTSLERQFDPENKLMDESQRKALIQALTREMAIIQGPPGTGKTFLGVEIVAALLQNRIRWCITEPILVVCYTNQALDQFLQRIHQRIQSDMASGLIRDHEGPQLVRLGTRSESSYIKDNKLLRRDILDQWGDQVPPLQMKGTSFRELYGKRDETELKLGCAAAILRLASKRMIDGKNTMLAMSDLHRKQFIDNYMGQSDTKGHILSADEKLASWLLVRQFSRDAQTSSMRAGDKMAESSSGDESDSDDKKRNKLAQEISAEVPVSLDEVFKKLTLEIEERSSAIIDSREEVFEALEIWRFGKDWEAEAQRVEREVLLFGKPVKRGEVRYEENQIKQDPVIQKAMNEHELNVLKAEPLSENEAEAIKNIFTLPKQRRWQLYAYWRARLIQRTRLVIPQLITEYKKCCDAIYNHRLLENANVFRRALVIGATTTGAAKYRELLESLKCRSVVVEEAAEVLEAHVLSTFLPSVEHVVLIGDHEQLRPSPSVYQLARVYGLDCSLFERLCKNSFPYATLQVQHRMRPEITDIIVRPHFYSQIRDHPDVEKYPPVVGMEKNLYFWSHDAYESPLGLDSVSHKNDYEILQAVELTRYLLRQRFYRKNEITILCTYAAQTNGMREAIGCNFGTNLEGRSEVCVETVDGFQGKENRVIILSLVRSWSEANTVGFLAVKNRICVSWTRAQHGLYVLGNMDFLAQKSELWNDLAMSLQSAHMLDYFVPIRCITHGRLQKILTPGEFSIKSPEGGCDMDCLATLPCMHKCPRKCHPYDDHIGFKCEVIVEKKCTRAIHSAEKQCHEQYGPCRRMVDVHLLCNHTTQIACFMRDEEAICTHRCDVILPCAHQCSKRCGERCNDVCIQLVEVTFDDCPYEHTKMVPCCKVSEFKQKATTCDHPCQEILACGHVCSNKCGEACTFECPKEVKHLKGCGHEVAMECYQDPEDILCSTLVSRKMPSCGHECDVPCFAGTNRKYCTKACFATLDCGLENSRHTCTMQCGQCYQNGHQCNSTCEKPLSCGHICLSRCGIPCAPCQQFCYLQCEHQVCGKASSRDDRRIIFERSCLELCALCVKACSNSCKHRTCKNKCYEECDVLPCKEICKKPLKCKHPCLGFCGERCPDICFKCNRQQYDYLIKNFLSEDFKRDSTLARFVQLLCSHTFPAAYLDAHVQKSRSDNIIISCPYKDCHIPIQLSNRYAIECKRAVIISEKQKAIKLARNYLDRPQQNATRLLLESLAKIIVQLKNSTPSKSKAPVMVHDRFQALLNLTGNIERHLKNPGIVQDIDYRELHHFVEWSNLLRLLECLLQLHRYLQFNNQKKLKRFSATRLCWLNDLFKFLLSDVLSVEAYVSNQICETANLIEFNMGSHLPGSYMPITLFELPRMDYNTLLIMTYRVISANTDQWMDIGKEQYDQIERLARKFQISDKLVERQQLLGELRTMLNKEIILTQKAGLLNGFILPEFKFPKF